MSSKPAPQAAVIKMYAARKEIYPREVKGFYANLRWACVWITQLVFYGLPWLSWNDRQAVLFDLGARKFHIFGLTLWPQDFIYLAALLIIAAFALFLLTAIAGRIWCGYACPQTVYTEIFMWIERRFEGNRSARMRLDRQPWSLSKLFRKSGKHLAWTGVALWTGLTFVGYFTPMRELLREAAAFTLGPWEMFWILFYGLATYGNAGWLREQVCKYMCPYARFQSAMFDKDTLIITYDGERGEPRGARAKQGAKQQANEGRGLGDCIDCTMCVQVCPVDIDIRNGLQYECIGCAACIDACNSVMDKVGSPRGLIRYATENATKLHLSPREMRTRMLRPRVLIYTAIFSAAVLAVGASLALRVPLKFDVIRDRGALAREVEEGAIENVYRLQIMNTDEAAHRYRLTVTGIDSIALATSDEIELEAASSRAVPVRVRVGQGKGVPGSNAIRFELQALDAPNVHAVEKAVFYVPKH